MHISSNYEFKKKKKGRKRKTARENKYIPYPKIFGVKEDLTPPKTSQLHHIFGKQKVLLQSRGDVTPNAPIEVPD